MTDRAHVRTSTLSKTTNNTLANYLHFKPLSHFLLWRTCPAPSKVLPPFLMTPLHDFSLGVWNARKNTVQTPPEEFVTHCSWAHTLLHGLHGGQGSCLIFRWGLRILFPWTETARESSNPWSQGSSFFPSHLPTGMLTGFRPGFSPNTKEKPTSWRRKRDHQTDRLGWARLLESMEPSDPPVGNHRMFSRLVLTPYRTRGTREDLSEKGKNMKRKRKRQTQGEVHQHHKRGSVGTAEGPRQQEKQLEVHAQKEFRTEQ